MRDLVDVAGWVVVVGLAIAPGCGQVVGVIEDEIRRFGGGGLLARVLSAFGRDQLVDRIVFIEAIGRKRIGRSIRVFESEADPWSFGSLAVGWNGKCGDARSVAGPTSNTVAIERGVDLP